MFYSLLLDAGCDVNRCTRDGTSLHVAVAGRHQDVVTILLDVCQSLLELSDSFAWTVVDLSLLACDHREHARSICVSSEQILQKLLKHRI